MKLFEVEGGISTTHSWRRHCETD